MRDGKDVAVKEFESYDTKNIIENIKRKYQNRIVRIFPDASGNARKTSASTTDIQMLRNAGFQVFANNRNPFVKDRINITNNRFDKDLLLVNTKRCPNLTEAIEQHAYDEKGEVEKITGAGTIDDYTDALRYLIWVLKPVTKVTFSTYNSIGVLSR